MSVATSALDRSVVVLPEDGRFRVFLQMFDDPDDFVCVHESSAQADAELIADSVRSIVRRIAFRSAEEAIRSMRDRLDEMDREIADA